MFGWFSGRREKAALLAENLRLKAAVAQSTAELLASPGTGIGMLGGGVNLSQHREQLLHFDGWQYVAIRAIATRVAGQGMNVCRKAKQSQPNGLKSLRAKSIDHNLEAIAGHPLQLAVDDPNPIMVRWSLLFVTVASLQLTGKAYWWFRGGDDGRLQIWPLPVSWVAPDHQQGLFGRWFVRPPGHPEGFWIDGPDLAFFHLPDPADPLSATAPLQSQSKAITADEQLQTAQYRAFQNGINPGVILTAGRMIGPDGKDSGQRPAFTPEQRAQLIEAVKAVYGGAFNHGEPIILDALIEKVEKLSHTPAEMDFINSGKQTKARIFQAFGVNPLIVGEIEGANRAQAYVAEGSFCSNVINPLLTLIGQTLTKFAGPRFGGVTIWFDEAVAHDDETESKEFQVAYVRGGITHNEFRKRLGLDPVPWGDVPVAPAAPPPAEPADLTADPQVKAFVDSINPYTLGEL